MEGTPTKPLLHTLKVSRRTGVNRVFAVVYTCAIFALLYHHALSILHSTTLVSFFISLSIFISDVLLGFMWSTKQSVRMRPIYRREFPGNLHKVTTEKDFPPVDIFICTADPYKEPPINVVNTALSVMAYDYPTEKLSVYVSDDGGSELTLFAFMEAAKFASHWLPFCRENKIIERCPDAYFRSNYSKCSDTHEKIKMMYESMKIRVENVVEKGKVGDEYITGEQERQAFNKWRKEGEGFTRQHHPTVIQVLLEIGRHKDIKGHSMPNLIYVSREKSKMSPHNFKAGALNVLVRHNAALDNPITNPYYLAACNSWEIFNLRVSGIMTNAPTILCLDCDMFSNDPRTPHRVLCYFSSDPVARPNLGYVQFPQRFHGLNNDDIYASDFRYLFPVGMDGLQGTSFFGTGCFFSRRVFFGGPSSFVTPEIPELCPDHVVDKPLQAHQVLSLAHHVAGCNYEHQTSWGFKMGFRYGTLVEDYYTGYRLQCEGWNSVFCHPERPAFLGDSHITLNDALRQNKRCSVGLLKVAFSKYCPITFGARAMGPLMGHGYAHSAFDPILSIPITIYGFLPQLALLNGLTIFPKVSDPWFFLYVFLFLGAYGQDCLDFILAQGTLGRWWSDQRMWMIRAVSAYLFGSFEYMTIHLGIATQEFNVTSKVLDDEQSRRYNQGIFEFGVPSPMFVPLAMAAIINLVAFLVGLVEIFRGRTLEGLFLQMFIAGFVVLNCWPIYEAMVLRTDKGRMPTKTTIISTFLAFLLYSAASLTL